MLEEFRKGWQRFWALSWWWKGPILGVTAFIVLFVGIALASSGDNDTVVLEATQVPSPTPETATATPTAKPSPTPAPTVLAATSVPSPTQAPEPTQTPAPVAQPTSPPPPTPKPTPTTPPASPPTPKPTQPPAVSCSASASVSNANPAQYSDVTVTGRLKCSGISPQGAKMHTVWHYKSTDSTCDGVADASGEASCTRGISRATVGYKVVIDVAFSLAGKTYSTNTSFTPQ